MPKIAEQRYSEKDFSDAVVYFVQSMRIRDFVTASMRLRKKYGDAVKLDVEMYCWREGVTFRGADGRLHLTREYASYRYMEILKQRGIIC